MAHLGIIYILVSTVLLKKLFIKCCFSSSKDYFKKRLSFKKKHNHDNQSAVMNLDLLPVGYRRLKHLITGVLAIHDEVRESTSFRVLMSL